MKGWGYILFVALTMLQCSLLAQDAFIYGKQGEKMYFRENANSIVISFKSQEHIEDSVAIASIIKNADANAQYKMLTPQMMEFQTSISFDSIVAMLSDYSDELVVSKVYYPVSDNHIHWSNNRIVVILQSEELLRTLLLQLSVEYESISIFDEKNGIYLLTLQGIEDKSIQVANMLYETGLVASAQPDFYLTTELCNPYYCYQWGLHNTGQYGLAYSGIDIKAPEAWDITRGNNVKVAVIDCGVDLTHPDLYNNLLPGYDATDINGGTYGGCSIDIESGHGTACAGIIAAEDNNIGIVGIASSSKIIPIRAGTMNNNHLFVYSHSQMADAINKAWNDSDANVLSISLPLANVSIINSAINNALTFGRNNKGCVISASAGNYYSDEQNPIYSVYYPASDSHVIAVGAMSTCGERCSFVSCEGETGWGSCYGTELSVVAPGTLIPTTDIQDIYGYNPTKPLHVSLGALDTISEFSDLNYTKWFAGTSAAAPHVSGVAALMLSVNPNLTSAQVKDIIEQTAQRVRDVNEDPVNGLYSYTESSDHPNGPWNIQMGYGLVNAHAAVMEAYFYNHYIDGSSTISACDNPLYYELNSTNIPNNTTVAWSVSSNLDIVSSNNAGAYIRAIGPGTGTITVTFTHEGCEVVKEKQVTIGNVPISDYYYNYSTTGNMTFNNELYINGTFTINSGHVVTISCIGHCLPDAKIVVQPGGKLIVNDGKLTSYCPDKMWDGIYVVGNKNQRQLAQYQGTLEVKNGSLIENAKCAIHNWNGSNYNTSGGIITVSGNSILHNNGRAAEFVEYMNTNANGSQVNDASGFQFCTFKNDDNNIFSSNNITFQSFVKMSGVKGIGFTACNFRNDCSTVNGQQYAIESIGSGFAVGPHCSGAYNINTCVCGGNLTKSKFARMGRGIKATNNGSTYSFTVEKTLFDTCYWSVAVEAVNNYSVTESDFNETSYPTFRSSTAGINTKYSTGFTIEGNNFYTLYTTHPSILDNGIYCSESGSDDNTIYRNTFEGFYYALMTGNNANTGLQFLCNDFKRNFSRDVFIESMAPIQGSSTKSAGNKFTTQTPYNITTTPYPTYTYYHSGSALSSNLYYPSVVSNNVTRTAFATVNNCNSTLCGFNIVIDPILGKPVSDNNDISLYESLQQIYESRLADYDAAGYGFLLGNFEDGDADIVATARLMQDTLISIRRTMAEIANHNIDAILQDTVIFDREALNGWYNRINTQTAKYSLVNSYFEMGEYALARQELAAIPQRFALTTDELAEYDNFCQYQSLREAVYTDGRNYAQLTEDEIAELQRIVERNTGVSSAYANSVLCFFYGICRDEEIDIDFDIDAPMNSKSTTEVVEENAEPLAIYVYPNPADEELNILLNSLPEGKTMIEFHDVTGRLVLSEEIKSANTSINISSLKQGVYMYRIVNGDNIIARDRIVKE